MLTELANARVTVMGLGRFAGGVGVTRWLARQGARVTVTDVASAEKLAASLEQIRDLEVTLHLGAHDERDFTQADLVVVNPAVPESSPFLAAARRLGVPITTEINLFLVRCPAYTIGVTGSVGKSTTTAMIGHVLGEGTEARRFGGETRIEDRRSRIEVGRRGSLEGREAEAEGRRGAGRYSDASRGPSSVSLDPQSSILDPDSRVFVGGNIGTSLLEALPEMRRQDVVVLELSSFQLQRTPLIGWSPDLAVVTNITPNHLDWHGTFQAYADAKLNIARFPRSRAGAAGMPTVILQDTAELRQIYARAFDDRSAAWCYGLYGDTPGAGPFAAGAPAVTWADLELEVPGRHNRENAAAALAVAHWLGVSAPAACAALATFAALPHRLQKVAEMAGVTYYDDSKSTTPEAALTALDALEGPVLLILGGYDKGSDFAALARRAAARTRFCACIGTTGPRLAQLVRDAGGQAQDCGELVHAVVACRARARPGDTILLSPACASWDQFADYRVRGRQFAQLARGAPSQA